MTYYSEAIQSPVSADYVRSTYGVDPDNATHIGIYPLVPGPADYPPARYEKRGNSYYTIPSQLSSAEVQYAQRQCHLQTAATWWPSTPYASGDLVRYNDELYSRRTDGSGTDAPDIDTENWTTAFPLPPAAPTYMWSDVIEASGPSTNFRFDPQDPQFLQLQVGDRIRMTDPVGVIPVDAEVLTISPGDGVTTWSEPTTVSGSNIEFKVSTYRP